MDTPRDDEELNDDEEPVADEDPSEEEEFEALMEAASEQAAEGVIVPEQDADADGEVSAEPDDGPASGGTPERTSLPSAEPAPAAEAVLDGLDSADRDSDPSQEDPGDADESPATALGEGEPGETDADTAETEAAVDADAVDGHTDATEADAGLDADAARARAEEEHAQAAASLASVRSETPAPAPTEPTLAARPTPAPSPSRNNEIARLLALVLSVAGLCTVSIAFLKLRERPPSPPLLVQLPPNLGPLQMASTRTEVPAGVAAVDEDAVASPPAETVDTPPEDSQVAVAPDPETPAEADPLTDVEPDPEPEPDPTPPVVVVEQPEPAVEPPTDTDDSGGEPEDVVFAPEPSRDERLTAVQQLALLRGEPSGESSVDASAEPVTVIALSAARRRSLEAALATADREFVRALVEDAAGLPARVGNAEWARLRQMPGYHRTLQTIYDHVLSTDDKVRLVGGQRGSGEVPESTPAFVRDLELPPVDLDRVRDDLWNAKSDNITTIVRRQL